MRVVRRTHPVEGSAGPSGRHQRPREIVGGVPVVGQLCDLGGIRLDRRHRLEGRRERGVESRLLPGQESLVDRLPHQGVAKGELVGRRVERQDVALDRLPQPGVDLGVVQPRDRPEQRDGDVRTGRRRDSEQVLGRLGQRRDASQQDLAQGRREDTDRRVGRQQLLDVEGVAIRPLGQLIDEAWWRVDSNRSNELGDLWPVEREQFDPFDVASPLELGHERKQGMPSVKLVASVRRYEDDGPAEVPPEVPEQGQRRRVRPMDVFDDEQQRTIRGNVPKHREEGLQESPLARDRRDLPRPPTPPTVTERGPERAGRARMNRGP